MVVLNEAGQLVVDLGAVLHGAGALADLNVHIGAQGLLGQTGVVAQYPVLGHLRQIDRSAPGHTGGDGGKAVAYLLGYLSAGLGDQDAPLTGGAQLIDNGLVPLCLVEAHANLLRAVDSFHTSPLLSHRISASAEVSSSRSSLVWISVTQ